jgi:hypothetical protein
MQAFTSTKPATIADFVSLAADWPKIVIDAWAPKLILDYSSKEYGSVMGGFLIGPAAFKIFSPTINAFGDMANNVVGVLGSKVLGTAVEFSKLAANAIRA